MKTSNEGIELIKHFEDRKLETHKDSEGVPSIGHESAESITMGK